MTLLKALLSPNASNLFRGCLKSLVLKILNINRYLCLLQKEMIILLQIREEVIGQFALIQGIPQTKVNEWKRQLKWQRMKVDLPIQIFLF